MLLRKTLILAFVMGTAAGCSDGGSRPTPESAPPIILLDYRCGDNCYLTYLDSRRPNDTLTAICLAVPSVVELGPVTE